jgi:sulfoxide reductase heme-binding subunit YedZ
MRWVIKPIVWMGCLVPAGILAVRARQGNLTANPLELLTNWTGYTTLVLVMVTLAVTPVRRLTGWNAVIKLRRLIGLFAFFYACIHFSIYIGLDIYFDWPRIAEDILQRPYITVGFTAFVLMIPLAVTSTKGWIRRLGKRWTKVHRLIYATAAFGVLHYYWKVKADTREPLIFAAILIVLMLLRTNAVRQLATRLRNRRRLAPAE